MRVTIAHTRTKAEIIQAIDRSFNDAFQGAAAGLPVQIVVDQKSWTGSILTFALKAKMGFVSTPIKGTVEVTDHDVIVDADLGMLNRFISEDKIKDLLGSRVKKLLN
jgi:hypothetical protein